MKQCYFRYKCLVISCLLAGFGLCTNGQDKITPDTSFNWKNVVAGEQYRRSAFHQWLWGRHYRPEWVTPVRVSMLSLDTAFGGLTPYESGGGNQSNTLKLRTSDGNEYVLRSIDKSFSRALPEIYKNTFVENLINDQVSIGHPYAAVTIPSMAAAAGIHHAQPVIRFVPRQQPLGNFNNEFGHNLYLLEQRPAEKWPNAEKVISTEELLQALLQDNNTGIDQELYVRTRLFDMFIGDWSRHEDQWRWMLTEKNGKKIYQPIPRDRDQAYTKFDGVLLRVALSAAGLSHLENFEDDVKDITTFNFTARNLDRRMTNATSLEVWVNNAKELQAALTNEIIESAIRQLPPEVYPLSGEAIISKLKSRRDKLEQFATNYYRFLAEEVDIPGSHGREHFEITRMDGDKTKVSIYKLDENGKASDPFFERVFDRNETEEIRIYGIAGSDTYEINGEADNDIALRIIGGPDADVITDHSTNAVTHIYDDGNNTINKARGTKLHLSDRDTIHAYRYDAFTYDKKGIKPTIFFSNNDRFYAGIGYEATKQGWRKEPFASKHGIYARYSITQNAFSVGYQGIVTHAVGKWDLLMNADYDAIRWTNFFGIGNETKELPQPQNNFDYYRVRTREAYVGIGLNRKLGEWSYLRFTPFYQATQVINDEGRFLADNSLSPLARTTDPEAYTWDNYGGVSATLLLASVDNVVIPRKGIAFSGTASHIRSLESDRIVNNFTGMLNLYVPLGNRLGLAIRNGGGTLTGEPKFYQLNSIGGSQTLKGYRRDRFRARTVFYNSNELQWLFDFKSKIFNGKVGPIAFYDVGRVWQPGEESNLWHSGYGGGILIAPFNRVSATISYGVSNENKVFHLRLNRAF